MVIILKNLYFCFAINNIFHLSSFSKYANFFHCMPKRNEKCNAISLLDLGSYFVFSFLCSKMCNAFMHRLTFYFRGWVRLKKCMCVFSLSRRIRYIFLLLLPRVKWTYERRWKIFDEDFFVWLSQFFQVCVVLFCILLFCYQVSICVNYLC